MRCRALAGRVGLALLIGVLLAAGNRTATVAWADPSGIEWDISMYAPERPCPGGTENDGDPLIIGEGECPDVTSTFRIESEGGTQSFFDRANAFWSTGPLGSDVTGDTIDDATDGLVPNRPEVLGAKVGQIHLQIQSNLVVEALLQNNIDDVKTESDPDVTGQPFTCGATNTLLLEDDLELWNAITDDTNGIVSAAETQKPDRWYYRPCDVTGRLHTPACPPKGVTMLPQSVQELEATLGVPLSRSYGIARMPIVGGIESDMDVNFLVYRLDEAGMEGYMALTLIQYPGLRSPNPNGVGYDPLAQILKTCPPYEATVTVYGVTSDPDFNEDGVIDLDVASAPELNRLVVCSGAPCGTYDYTLRVSMAADYDGDTIPGYADRCDTDPNSGSATDDSDGDTLTGPCDTNGEGTNPKVGGWNAKPVWDQGQDVDGDGYLNYVDNCPTVADRDLNSDGIIDYQRDSDGEGVGDVCDPAPTIPGDGKGYLDPFLGMFSDYDDLCNDPWTVGAAEGIGEPRAYPGRYCLKADGLATNWNDSNDDGVPDYLDLTALGGGVMADYNSDSDTDGCADGKEVGPNPALGGERDPLDKWDFYDVPVPAIYTVCSSPGVCSPVPTRDKVAGGITTDVQALLKYSGAKNTGSDPRYNVDLDGNTVEDGLEYDRTTSAHPGQLWRSGPPDGTAGGITTDVQAMLKQAGHKCVVPP
jgi:hypothetical protein